MSNSLDENATRRAAPARRHFRAAASLCWTGFVLPGILVLSLGADRPPARESPSPLHLPKLVVDRHYRPKVGDRAVLAMPVSEDDDPGNERRLRKSIGFLTKDALQEFSGRAFEDELTIRQTLVKLELAKLVVTPPLATEVKVLALEEFAVEGRQTDLAVQMAEVEVVSGDLKGLTLYVDSSGVNRLVPNPQFKAFDPEAQAVEILIVHDGHTLTVRTSEGPRKLTLIGLADPVGIPEESPVNNIGRVSWLYLKQMIEKDQVYIERDPELSRANAPGGAPVYLYRASDGLFINRWLLEHGFGQVARDQKFQKRREFQEVEREAKSSERGLWSPLGPDGMGPPVLVLGVLVSDEPEPKENAPKKPPQGEAPPLRPEAEPDPAAEPPRARPPARPPLPTSHFCGAITQKGTPCRRRVAGPGPGFCYLHRGN